MPDIKPGKYLHYKGHICDVIGVGRHSETLEEMVFYRHDSKDFGPGSLWARPKAMFLEMVIVDGKEMPRFKYLG